MEKKLLSPIWDLVTELIEFVSHTQRERLLLTFVTSMDRVWMICTRTVFWEAWSSTLMKCCRIWCSRKKLWARPSGRRGASEGGGRK